MKISEIITEAKTPDLSKEAEAAIPGARDWEELNQNNDGYLQYRFGIAAAAAPDEQYMPAKTATHQNLVTIGYTEADDEILDAAARALGVKGARRLTSRNSEEPPEINQTSVVAKVKRNKYGI